MRFRVALPAGALALLLAAACVWPAEAEVRVVTRADGSKVLVGEGGGEARSGERSSAGVLRPAPRSDLADLVQEHATARGLDPRLVRAVIQAESAWDPRAVSRKGAMGLMQLMPDTAVLYAVDDPFDAEQNVRGGTSYLAGLFERFGRLDLTLAAYNAGPTAVDRHGGVPPYAETREYVRRVLSLYEGRRVTEDEIRTAAPAAGGPPPRLVRDAAGRLVLTNTPAAPAPRPPDRRGSGPDGEAATAAAGG